MRNPYTTLCQRFSIQATQRTAQWTALAALGLQDFLTCDGKPLGIKTLVAGLEIGRTAWDYAALSAPATHWLLCKINAPQDAGNKILQGTEALVYASVLAGALGLNAMANAYLFGPGPEQNPIPTGGPTPTHATQKTAQQETQQRQAPRFAPAP